MTKVLDGKALAKRVKEELKAEVEVLKEKGVVPGLAVIIVGNDPASRTYVNNKRKDCAQVGIESFEYAMDENTTEEELLELIAKLNSSPEVDGILVQLPLPKHINEDKVIFAIDPKKDADCFHPVNVGKLMIGKPDFMPCTPAGVMEFIKESGIEIAGKECVVVGRSNIVGKPQAMLLLLANGTVTVCHSKTKDIKEVTKRADILVVAVGRAKMIDASYIKPGAVVIDVGINEVEGKLVGDVEFESAKEVASAITPVPGGVGPMTRAMLLKNTVAAAKLKKGLV
ncbi:MAG TPA: bifunctional methylenetetrahydrofolate dehydrogenase/methenyltetrahydrofolate cyclohydrolase FolD [Clostridia bacterium]